MASSAGDGTVPNPAPVACFGSERELTEPCMPGVTSAQSPSCGLIGLPTTLHRLASSIGTPLGRPTWGVVSSPAHAIDSFAGQSDIGKGF